VPIRGRDEVPALPGKLSIRTGTIREVSKPPSSFRMEINLAMPAEPKP
jgi:hypothetical protein